MTASKTHWHVTGKLEAYEGEQKILTRTWDKKIKRQRPAQRFRMARPQ
jgi:hypothetical protein